MFICYLYIQGDRPWNNISPRNQLDVYLKYGLWLSMKNGYFLDIDVFVGKPSDGDRTEHGLGERVVLQLTEPFRQKYHRVSCDNFFSSPALFDELLSRACGTVRTDRRGFPLSLKSLKLSSGEYKSVQWGSLSAVIWQDRRQVSVLSTLTDPDASTTVKRKEKDGTQTTLICPFAIVTYNRYMAGVDVGSALPLLQCLPQINEKLKVFILLYLRRCYYQCIHIVYSRFLYTISIIIQNQWSWRCFVVSCQRHWIGDYCSRLRAGRPRSSITPQSLFSQPTSLAKVLRNTGTCTEGCPVLLQDFLGCPKDSQLYSVCTIVFIHVCLFTVDTQEDP